MTVSKWQTHVKDKLPEIEDMSKKGLSEKQIAKNLGVGYSTFREYKKNHLALVAAIDKGRKIINYEVEGALIKRALGYEYWEVVEELKENENTGKMELRVTKRILKSIAPEVNAIKMWLLNHKGEEYKNDPAKWELDKEKLELQKKEIEARIF